MAAKHQTEAGKVLSDMAANAAEGFRQASKDAKDAAEKTVPVIKQGVSKGSYMLAYCLSFGAVYTAEVVLEFLPEDGVVRQGLRDGAQAARDSRAAHREASATAAAAASTEPAL